MNKDNRLSKMLGLSMFDVDQNKIDEEVKNYNNIKFNKTQRGSLIFLFIFLIIPLSFILSYFGLVLLDDVIIATLIYIIPLYFIYLGHRWAMVLLGIVWTLDKFFQVISMISTENLNPFSFIFIALWWSLVISSVQKAVLVENLRRSKSINNTK